MTSRALAKIAISFCYDRRFHQAEPFRRIPIVNQMASITHMDYHATDDPSSHEKGGHSGGYGSSHQALSSVGINPTMPAPC
jgi:hypothetical protein